MQEKLLKLLEAKNLNIFQLANKLNIPVTTVYNWFNGRNKPKLFYAQKLAKFFRKSINYFLD